VSGAVTTPAGRVAALARAELTLFGRSKGMIVTAVFVPLLLPVSVRSLVEDMDLKGSGLSIGLVLLPGAIGFS
jgi:ABC-2 type transport system permease protein